MKRFFNILLVAIMVVGLSYAVVEIQAAFSTITSGPVKNSGYLTQYLREVRGSRLIYATAGTATVGSPTVATTISGLEVGDVIYDIINFGAVMTSISEGVDPAGSRPRWDHGVELDRRSAAADRAGRADRS